MVKISVVIITYNEEKYIEQCIKSTLRVADEIVVVDSLSTDKTQAICNKLGVRFISQPFLGYKQQKNFAVSQASNDYILSLDADEALSVEMEKSIMKVKQNWQYDAYSFNRLNFFCGQWIYHTSWYPDRRIRLFDRRAGAWGGTNPHDVFVLSSGFKSSHLRGDMLHYTYNSFDQLLNVINKYSSISANEYFKNGIKPSFLKIVISPLWHFVNSYFIKRGFLDGYNGYVISVAVAKQSQLKYVKLRQLCLIRDSKVVYQHPMLVNSGIRIGFDAKRAFFNKSGLGNYSRNLIDSLVQLDGSNSIILFSPKIKKRINLKSTTEAVVSIISPKRIFRGFLSSLWRSRFIVNDIKRTKVDVYHGLSHELPFGISRSGAKSVVTVHDLIFLRYPQFYGWINVYIYKRKLEYACRVADRVVAISSQTKADLVDFLSVPPSKIDVIYQSCDVSFQYRHTEEELEAVKQKYGLPSSYILYVGTVETRKNLLNIVKAIHENNIDIPLVVIGRKTKYFHAEVLPYIEQNNVCNIVFPQFVPNEDLPAVYQGALCFVYPSVFEGFGIPILEALTSGVPVITSKGSCFEETGGSHSLYVDPDSPDQIADAIIRVVNNPDLRAEMGSQGYEHSKKFLPERIVEKYMELYRELLS